MEAKQYDIIIIGGGSAGLGALGMAQEFGWTPLMIDKEESDSESNQSADDNGCH